MFSLNKIFILKSKNNIIYKTYLPFCQLTSIAKFLYVVMRFCSLQFFGAYYKVIFLFKYVVNAKGLSWRRFY